MLQAAFSDMFSALQGATRKLCWMHCDEVVTQRSGNRAKTLRDTADFNRRCVASDSEYLWIHFRPCSLRQLKLARIAAEDTFEMGSREPASLCSCGRARLHLASTTPTRVGDRACRGSDSPATVREQQRRAATVGAIPRISESNYPTFSSRGERDQRHSSLIPQSGIRRLAGLLKDKMTHQVADWPQASFFCHPMSRIQAKAHGA